MSSFPLRFRAVAVLLVAEALLLTVAACGSGAVEGADDEASGDGGGGGNSGSLGNQGNGRGDEFAWRLPPGDTSAATQEPVILLLRKPTHLGGPM
jgi:hypothetical protein